MNGQEQGAISCTASSPHDCASSMPTRRPHGVVDKPRSVVIRAYLEARIGRRFLRRNAFALRLRTYPKHGSRTRRYTIFDP